ncbi:hypothetical protein [Jannaschia sp. R86511]|uniref:hypothetical protein n=1 Tax=Jannaschia sp. R86511 TaxID=3093853 RepID=UPI0036D3C47D
MRPPDPCPPPARRAPRRVRRATVTVLGAVLLAGAAAGCSQAEQAARSAAEDLARDRVAEATAAADEAASQAARAQAQQALDTTLDQLSGSCADVLALPAGVRDDQAHALLRAFWLTELTAEEPPAATAEAFAEAVVDRCDDSRETDAATVLREVWETGSYRP